MSQISETEHDDLRQARQSHCRFLSRLTHELRTPLGSVLMMAELLGENRGGSLDEKQLRYARKIHQAAADMRQVIEEVSQLAKIGAGRIEVRRQPVDLAELARRLSDQLRPLARDRGLELTVELADGVPETLCTDGAHLEQIVGHLARSALHATSQGGVSVRFTAPGESAAAVAVAVRDTGPAIAEDQRSTLFEPFFHTDPRTRRQHGGQSLELTIAKALAELLGGELMLSEEEDGGTTFVLCLPSE